MAGDADEDAAGRPESKSQREGGAKWEPEEDREEAAEAAVAWEVSPEVLAAIVCARTAARKPRTSAECPATSTSVLHVARK